MPVFWSRTKSGPVPDDVLSRRFLFIAAQKFRRKYSHDVSAERVERWKSLVRTRFARHVKTIGDKQFDAIVSVVFGTEISGE